MRGSAKRVPTGGQDQDPLNRLAAALPGGIRVAVVVEENELLRHGLAGLLAEDERLQVVIAGAAELPALDVDLAVVCSDAARHEQFRCPIVVCARDGSRAQLVPAGNRVAGTLDQTSLTGAQLRATVHAAAAGLEVNSHATARALPSPLEPRAQRVLELLADGKDTREIAEALSYSERTIKKLIAELEHRNDAANRVQLVAHALRRGLI